MDTNRLQTSTVRPSLHGCRLISTVESVVFVFVFTKLPYPFPLSTCVPSLFLEEFCLVVLGSPCTIRGIKGANLLQRNYSRHPSPVSFESYPDDDRRGTLLLKNGGRAHQGSRVGVSPVPQHGEHNAMFRSGGKAKAKKYCLVTPIGCVGA